MPTAANLPDTTFVYIIYKINLVNGKIKSAKNQSTEEIAAIA